MSCGQFYAQITHLSILEEVANLWTGRDWHQEVRRLTVKLSSLVLTVSNPSDRHPLWRRPTFTDGGG